MTISKNQPSVIFMGTPPFAVTALRALMKHGIMVKAVYTQPARASGRGQKLTPSPVAVEAGVNGLPIETPLNFKNQADIERLRAWGADVGVVAAYGLLLPQAVLDSFRLGCINIHASLLPRWRGAAPIERALLAGDADTGICIMQMDRGLDTGAVLARASCPITPTTTRGLLLPQLADMGADLLMDVLPKLPLLGEPQPENGVAYAAKITKEDRRIDWRQEAANIERQIRAFSPQPAAYCLWQGEPFKILSADIVSANHALSQPVGTVIDMDKVICGGSTLLQICAIKPAGKKDMFFADFMRGLANKEVMFD
jgi:methionyl-tRNA formyltransferase